MLPAAGDCNNATLSHSVVEGDLSPAHVHLHGPGVVQPIVSITAIVLVA